jgi:hypothetical protein
MLFDRRRRRVVVEVLVVASLMLATLGLGYLVLATSGEEDRLVTKGVQQVVICGGPRERGDILYKLTEEVPGAKSGTWGTEKDGDCRVMRHYAETGPAD